MRLGAPFAIGGLGALTYALRFMPGAPLLERAINVLTGSLVAGFLAPALLAWQQLTAPAYTYGAAFVVGLLGLSLIDALLVGIKDTKFGAIFTDWLSRRRNNGAPPP